MFKPMIKLPSGKWMISNRNDITTKFAAKQEAKRMMLEAVVKRGYKSKDFDMFEWEAREFEEEGGEQQQQVS